jgi:diguanylate cyclase (GGDEF)-like protein
VIDEPLFGDLADVGSAGAACVRSCPVDALRLTDGGSRVIAERCIGCGACAAACGNPVRDDTPRVLELLESRRAVVALLATEYVAALYPMTTSQVERSLELLGFCSMETTLLGEEIVATAYERLHARDGSLLSLRSTCPVAVSFVRKFHPGLVPALAPIVPPYIAQARLIREVYPDDVAIVYVSPCFARKDEALSPEFEGVVDVAIDFSELRRLMEHDRWSARRLPSGEPVDARHGVVKEISLTDGFPRKTLLERDMTDTHVAVVRGIPDIDRLLRAMASGETGPAIVDMLYCRGCIDGPAVRTDLSLYAKRAIDAAARRIPTSERVSTREMLCSLPAVPTVRSFDPAPVARVVHSEADIDAALAAGRLTRAAAPDCGACGHATCVEHAVAVLDGAATWELCLPLQHKLLDQCDAERRELVTVDPVTGLPNERVLAERLELEFARHLRYEEPFSALVVGVDPPDVADGMGPATGVLLAALGARMSSSVRATDLVARHGSDRIVVLLPGISKTAAFAVAEKLRRLVGDSPLAIASDGYTGVVTVTISVGVAAARPPMAAPRRLLDPPECALSESMAAGRDRVRLAAG